MKTFIFCFVLIISCLFNNISAQINYDAVSEDKYIIEQDLYDTLFTKNTRDSVLRLKKTLEKTMKTNIVGKKIKLNTTVPTIDAVREDTVQHFAEERTPNIIHFETNEVFLSPLENQYKGLDFTNSRDLRVPDNFLQRSLSDVKVRIIEIPLFKNKYSIVPDYGERHLSYDKIYSNNVSKYFQKTRYNYYHRGIFLKKMMREVQRFKYFDIASEQEKLIEYLDIIYAEISAYYPGTTSNAYNYKTEKSIDLMLNMKGVALDYSTSIRDLIEKTNDKELISLEAKLRELSKNIANKEMILPKEQVNKLKELDNLRKNKKRIISKILKNKTLRKRINKKIIKWQDVQKELERNEVAIDIIEVSSRSLLGCYEYYVAIIKKHSHPIFISLATEEILLHTNQSGQPKYIRSILYRKELYKKIWQPILPYLKGIKTVHISPAGLLHRISFEALQDEKRQYLAARFQFHYYSSMRDFIKKELTNHSYKDAVLMGDILYDLEDISEYQSEEWYTMRNNRDKVRRLKATLEEVTEINNICNSSTIESTLLTVDKATEDTVQYFSGEYAPSILHFATHGLFLEPIDTSITGSTVEKRLRGLTNPLQRSVLMLYGANHRWEKNEPIIGTDEDGILTALEVTALDLQNTDLVVLSACSTGLGDVHNTEGVFGLQRAFKLAGVNHVVVSLWDVDDAATKDLMVKFYENLLKEKQDPATALRNAKNHFRNKGYEPVDWAGFILIE